MKIAERDGYKKGFLDGVQEGKKQAENEQAATVSQLVEGLEKFVASVTPLFISYRNIAQQIQQEMPKVSTAIARKIAGLALDQNAHNVINDIAVRCCETMALEPKITITVHDSLGDALEKHLQSIAARLPAATDIIIVRSADMGKSDCRIDWQNGFMERTTEQLWQQIETVINDMTITAGRSAAQGIQQLQSDMAITITETKAPEINDPGVKE